MKSNYEAYICNECKDQLVQFHIFKKNVKQYTDFQRNIQQTKIFLKLEPQLLRLKKLNSYEDLKIVNYLNTEILIAQQSQQDRYALFQSCQPEISLNTLKNEEKIEEPLQVMTRKRRKAETDSASTVDEIKLIEDPVVENEDLNSSEMSKDDSTEVGNLTELPIKQTTNSLRWNTNSILTEEQKAWIYDDAKNSAVKLGQKISWKCSQCGSQMSSAWVLRKHLRDVHIIKPTKRTRENKRGKDFMDEVRSSQGFDKIQVGDKIVKESFWKCKRCDNVLKSESGFIKHLLYTHIKNSYIDPSFIAKCKIQIEYEEDRPSEHGWSCPECKKFYRTSMGIKNHFKLEHPEIDFGGEQYQKKIKEVNERSTFLKEEEKQSEIILETESGTRRIWQCHRCPEPRYFRTESGFKAHVRHSHLHNRKLDERKIAKCKIVIDEVGVKQRLWQCPLCAIAMKTKEGFVSHVTQIHPGEFDDNDQEPNLEKINEVKVKADEDLIQKLTEQVTNDRGGPLKVDGYKFSCNECGLFFSKHYPTHVDAHKTFKDLASSYQLPKCEQCHVIYSNDDAMQKHLDSHVEESAMLQIYPSKGLAFFGGKEFKDPTGTADDAIDDNIWKCGHCCAMFWDESECVQHQMMLHVETLICPIDQLTFSGNRGLAMFCTHMKNKHTEFFPNLTFPCTYCKQEFRSILEKLSHMKACGEKKLECDECGKKFFSKIKLAHHLKVEKGLLSYECSICSRKYTNSMDLKLHVVGAHTNDRLYQCTFRDCDKSFKTSAARSSHMELHSNVSLKCTFCDSVFKKRVILARHIKLMHDESYREERFKEFSCKLCNKSFLRPLSFRNHLKSVHHIIEEEQED